MCKGALKSFQLAVNLPEKIEAMALKTPLPQVLFLNDKLAQLKNWPIFIHHGKYDVVVPMVQMNNLISRINDCHSDITFVETLESHDSYRKDERKISFDFFKSIYDKNQFGK